MLDPYAVYTVTGDRLLVFSHAEHSRVVWLTQRLLLWEGLLSRVRLWR